MTKPLSPAAAAVMIAVKKVSYDWENMSQSHYTIIAAALRDVAKQSIFADTRVGVTNEVVLVDTLLAIAAELEVTNG